MISLIVCTRNRAPQLRGMLAALLESDFARHDVEVVLVDSASTDDTPQVIAQFAAKTGARTVRVERAGLGLARNAGIERSSGRLLAFTDDDCYVAATYFEALKANFGTSQYQYGMGSVLLFDPTDDRRVANYTIEAKRELPPYSLLPAGAIQGANMFFLRDVFDRVGPFDARLGAGTPFPCEDIEMAARASLAGFTGVQLPQPAVYHHHGRKAGSAEAEETLRQYDFGRGAYYASLLSRGVPSAWDLWKACSGPLGSPPNAQQLERLEREFDAAHRLLRHQREALRTA
jgi:GT2 family glycosyltransferase